MIKKVIKKNPIIKSKLKFLLGYSTIIFAIIKLKKSLAKCKNWKEIIDLVYSYQFYLFRKDFFRIGIIPLQIKEELIEFIKLLIRLRPRVIFECGTALGGNLFLLTRFSTRDAIIISVDLPGGKFGGGYPPWKIPFYKSFASYNQKIILIREDSHKLATLERVKKILKETRFNLVFIDGDHSYDGVKKDFKLYHPFVRTGGIVVLHDIVPSPNEKIGVPRFWREIHQKYKYREIVKDWNQKWGGIGVVFV